MSTAANGTGAERPRRRNDRARGAIVTAAHDLLHEVGFERFTVEAVAARAGVGKQTIYRWWPNRAVLVADALLQADALDPVPPRDTGDVRADLTRWAGELAALLGSPRGAATVRMLTAAAVEDPETSRELHRRFSGPLQDLAAARLDAAPELASTPVTARRSAVDALIGFLLFRVLAHQTLDRKMGRELAGLVLSGLTAAGPRPVRGH